jgi:hypothetical protein
VFCLLKCWERIGMLKWSVGVRRDIIGHKLLGMVLQYAASEIRAPLVHIKTEGAHVRRRR